MCSWSFCTRPDLYLCSFITQVKPVDHNLINSTIKIFFLNNRVVHNNFIVYGNEIKYTIAKLFVNNVVICNSSSAISKLSAK